MGKFKIAEDRAMDKIKCDELDLVMVQQVAQCFVQERIEEVIKDVENVLLVGEMQTVLWHKNSAQKEIGKWLAVAYSKGYCDGKENLKLGKRIII